MLRTLSSIHISTDPDPELIARLLDVKRARGTTIDIRTPLGRLHQGPGWISVLEASPGELHLVVNLGERPKQGGGTQHQPMRFDDKYQARNAEILERYARGETPDAIRRNMNLRSRVVTGVLRRHREEGRGATAT